MQDSRNWKDWHGFGGDASWPLPKMVAQSNEACRSDQHNTILANEYLDSPEVLDAKMEVIAGLVRKSKLMTAYTGAGLSKASGIPDYATKAKDTVVKAPKLRSPLDAAPTYAHRILTEMARVGYLKHWIQQNHDGLPQKAGFPQEMINEIHGAWFDPSNPVVQFSGKLRGDLFDWMAEIEHKIDLCLCLGTSLSGMNADRTANTPAKASLKRQKGILGTVIINLQQTPLDTKCVVRVWAKLDDAFRLLAEKLAIDADPPQVNWRKRVPANKDVWLVPYDAEGRKSDTCMMEWDLRQGAEIRIPVEGAMNFGATGKIIERSADSFTVELREKKYPCHRLLGIWWVESALRGSVPQLPVVNISPKIIPKKDDDNAAADVEKMTLADEPETGFFSWLSSPFSFSSSSSSSSTSSPAQPTSIKIVQSHRIVTPSNKDDQNNHKWKLSLAPGSENLVSQVVYRLHPSFFPSKITCSEAPFEISRLGWGTFTIDVEITLKDSGKVLKTQHQLTFDGEGDSVKETLVAL